MAYKLPSKYALISLDGRVDLPESEKNLRKRLLPLGSSGQSRGLRSTAVGLRYWIIKYCTYPHFHFLDKRPFVQQKMWGNLRDILLFSTVVAALYEML
jgi:hypothetical protein